MLWCCSKMEVLGVWLEVLDFQIFVELLLKDSPTDVFRHPKELITLESHLYGRAPSLPRSSMKMTENLTVLHKLLHSTKGYLSLKDLTFCKMKQVNKGKLMMDDVNGYGAFAYFIWRPREKYTGNDFCCVCFRKGCCIFKRKFRRNMSGESQGKKGSKEVWLESSFWAEKAGRFLHYNLVGCF